VRPEVGSVKLLDQEAGENGCTVHLQFNLTTGTYATAFLRELLMNDDVI
jgi:tRNA(Glu) U13 pseudouridine synthase TruD